MALSFLVIILITFVGQSVLAGHPLWESYHNYSVAISAAENATAVHGLDKRHVHIKTGTASGDIKLWPDKTIKYCWDESTNAKAKLNKDLKSAMTIWYRAGLPKDFKMSAASSSQCKSDRTNVLMISYNGEGKMATSSGKVPAGLSGGGGPSMVLTDDETMGMLNKVSNYAHEIGHAFGLIHEHQNPYFWEVAYGGEPGSVFGSKNFNCQNLKDYSDALGRVEQAIRDYPGGMGEILYGSHREKICTNQDIAKQYKFSAADYLPFSTAWVDVDTQSEDEIDWESIMIYPSGAGATGDAQPGADNRLRILQKPDGNPIEINLNPSPRDVQGLIAMYGMPKNDDPALLATKSNSKFTRFMELFGKSKGGGSCPSS